MRSLESHIESLDKAQAPGSLFDSFVAIMEDFGYNRVTYGFATDHPTLGIQRQLGQATSFPSDWINCYTQNNLIEIDPIPNYMLKSAVPSFWSGVSKNLTKKAEQFMKDAAEVGLKDGALIPLHSVHGEVAGISVSCEEPHPCQKYENLAALQFLSHYFHERYKSFLKQQKEFPEFSDRQREILLWAFAGKTDAEIALIINRSLPTVRYHWNKICRKLNVYGRTHAMTKALMHKLVLPYQIIKNYHN